MKRKMIPFGVLPSTWGLEGKDRQRAYAHYTLEGDELDRELLSISHDDKNSEEYKIALATYDLKQHKLNQNEYDKMIATIKGESYFKVLKGEYANVSNDQGTMSFELDWNDVFVRELEEAGWTGKTADSIVNSWFEDACKQMFAEDPVEPIATVTPYRTRKKNVPNSGKTEYS